MQNKWKIPSNLNMIVSKNVATSSSLEWNGDLALHNEYLISSRV